MTSASKERRATRCCARSAPASRNAGAREEHPLGSGRCGKIRRALSRAGDGAGSCAWCTPSTSRSPGSACGPSSTPGAETAMASGRPRTPRTTTSGPSICPTPVRRSTETSGRRSGPCGRTRTTTTWRNSTSSTSAGTTRTRWSRTSGPSWTGRTSSASRRGTWTRSPGSRNSFSRRGSGFRPSRGAARAPAATTRRATTDAARGRCSSGCPTPAGSSGCPTRIFWSPRGDRGTPSTAPPSSCSAAREPTTGGPTGRTRRRTSQWEASSRRRASS
mmetsp:Transcript_5978/g.14841  ORF Transcript_5978/g.14841 Transcript_5978/m.14841 type:complete len:275 (-) Transcript_5978:101-925(-)